MVVDGVRELSRQVDALARRPRRNLDDVESINRFQNRIRVLDADADKQWAIDNGGTEAGSDPISLFLQDVLAAIEEDYTAQCFVVEPNRMLAEVEDATPAAEEGKNSGIYLIPERELVTVPKTWFGQWFYIGRRFDYDADDNDFVSTPKVLKHPEEKLVTSDDEDFDRDDLESYTTGTKTSNEAVISYIASGSRTAILGRVKIPSADGETISGDPIIEQNVTGLVKLAWNIAPKLLNLFIEAWDYDVDFKIYPTLLIGDGAEVISSFSNATQRWSVFAPNWQLFHRPGSLQIVGGNRAVSILPSSVSEANLDTDADFWILDESGLRMYTGPIEFEQSKSVVIHRTPAYIDITDWNEPYTHVRADAYGAYVKGFQYSDYLDDWTEIWSVTGDGEGHASAKVCNDDGGSYAKLDSTYPNLYLYRGDPHSDNRGYSDLSISYWFGGVEDCGDWYLNFSSIPEGSTAQWVYISVPQGFDPQTGMPTSWANYNVFGWTVA